MNVLFISLLYLFISNVLSETCSLITPSFPLTVTGLEDPFILLPQDNSSNCSIFSKDYSIVIEIVILDLTNYQFYIYNPTIIDNSVNEYIKTTKFSISDNYIIGIWIMSDKISFILDTFTEECITINDKFAHCNTKVFFETVNNLISANKIILPVLEPHCLTTRSFPFLYQYQELGITSKYIISNKQRLFNNTPSQIEIFDVTKIIDNYSNSKLLTDFLNIALKCVSLTGIDLIDMTTRKSSLALNEIQASMQRNQAFIPSGHPSVLVDGKPNLEKLNKYRSGFNQPVLSTLNIEDTKDYCNNIYDETGLYLFMNYKSLSNFKSPNMDISINLIDYMAERFVYTWNLFNCSVLTNKDIPFNVMKNENGIIISNNILEVYGDNSIRLEYIFYIIISILTLMFLSFLISTCILYCKYKKYKKETYLKSFENTNLEIRLKSVLIMHDLLSEDSTLRNFEGQKLK